MLKRNNLFLLLITIIMLAFACTTKRQANPPVPIDEQETSEDSEALTKLKEQLQAQQALFADLQTKYSNLSSLTNQEKQNHLDQLEASRQSIARAEQAAKDAAQSSQALQQELAKLQKTVEEQKEKDTEVQTQINNSTTANNTSSENNTTTDNNTTTETEEEGATEQATARGGNNTTADEAQQASTASDSNQLPSIRFFMVEKKILPTDTDEAMNSHEQRTFKLKRGTLLSVVSDKDITITAVDIGDSATSEEQRERARNVAKNKPPFAILMMNFPLALQLTYADSTYCAKATITSQHMPQDNSETRPDGSVRGKEEPMRITAGECQ